MQDRIRLGDQINWNQVFYFSEIAAWGSVKGAAEKLNLSPSTLSEHLSQLENDLNVKLFYRQHRRLQLTREGAMLFHCAREMFETGKRFVDFISPMPLGCYPISIGIVPSLSCAYAYRIINCYLKDNRDISINVHNYLYREMETAILEAKLDFGFTDRRSERKDIVQTMIVASDLDFFVSRDLPDLELKEHLRNLPLVICRSERSVQSAIEEVLDSAEIVPKNIVVSEYPLLVEVLCREGTCVAVSGGVNFEKDPRVKKIRLPADFPKLTERLYAMWRVGAENLAAVKGLREILPNLC